MAKRNMETTGTIGHGGSVSFKYKYMFVSIAISIYVFIYLSIYLHTSTRGSTWSLFQGWFHKASYVAPPSAGSLQVPTDKNTLRNEHDSLWNPRVYFYGKKYINNNDNKNNHDNNNNDDDNKYNNNNNYYYYYKILTSQTTNEYKAFFCGLGEKGFRKLCSSNLTNASFLGRKETMLVPPPIKAKIDIYMNGFQGGAGFPTHLLTRTCANQLGNHATPKLRGRNQIFETSTLSRWLIQRMCILQKFSSKTST